MKGDGLNARQRDCATKRSARSLAHWRSARSLAHWRSGKIGSLAAIAVAAVAWISTTGEPARAEVVPAPGQVTIRHADQIAERINAIAARQVAIARITEAHFSDNEQSDEAVELSDRQVLQSEPVVASAARIAGLLPELPALMALESDQAAQIAELTRRAEASAEKAERAIRRAGLNPRLVMAKVEDRGAQGGPLDALSESEPKLINLGKAVSRMSALQRGLDKLPTHLPAALESMTSSFGYRSDPFTGGGAMHAGIDFRGATGTPIQAAADGTVSFVGVKGGYGKVVEITHGNGMMTRYAHMSKFKARAGQTVAAGDTIGAIGSTGRSTGPHLHFEVRINGAAVNPRPFLEART